jgi:hypothetical protein
MLSGVGDRLDEDVVRAALRRFVFGGTPVKDFEAWVYASTELERVLGPAEYAYVAATDFSSASEVRAVGDRLERFLESRWPREPDRAKARIACEGLVDGTIDLVRGCAILASLARRGMECIPEAFAAWHSELDGVPTAAQYALWDPAALQRKLAVVEPLREEIVRAALGVLERLDAASDA